jgi:hypothetical protein
MTVFGARTGSCVAEMLKRLNPVVKTNANIVCVTGGAVAPPENDQVPHRTASV